MAGFADTLYAAIPPIPTRTVLTCLVWYMVSSITSQLSKVILLRSPYPLFLSLCQFLIGAALSFLLIAFSQHFPAIAAQYLPRGSVPVDAPERPIFTKGMFLQILPLGVFQFVGKFFLLNATSLISLAAVSSIKALSPLMVVAGYRVFYGVKLPLVTYLLLTPLVLGVVLMIALDSIHKRSADPIDQVDLANTNTEGKADSLDSRYELHEIVSQFIYSLDFNQIKGLTCCLLSAVVFAGQNIYSKQLVTWDATPNTHPASLVLSTTISRPGTPLENGKSPYELQFNHSQQQLHASYPSQPYYNSPTDKKMRQRTNSIRLPYSSSDLQLDDKFQKVELQHMPYSQAVQQNNQMLGTKSGKPDKMTIILYISIIGFICSFGGFLTNELPQIRRGFNLTEIEQISTNDTTIYTSTEAISVVILVFLDSLSHFAQTLLAFHLLGLIPALSYSVASMMKRIVLITVSILLAIGVQHDATSSWLGRITTEQAFGLILIAFGLYCYDKWGSTALKGLSMHK